MNSKDKLKDFIPERSFGHCNWCGEDNVRLHYLMCNDCFRISNMVPSKAQVLLNRPDLKKKYKEIGATIKNVASDLRRFLLDPKTRFPNERYDKEHWEKIQEEGADNASSTEVNILLDQMQEQGVDPLPEQEEVERLVGIDKTLRFMMRVGVLRGVLKMDSDGEDDEFFRKMIESCMENAIAEDMKLGGEQKPSLQENKPRAGMATRDLVMKRRK